MRILLATMAGLLLSTTAPAAKMLITYTGLVGPAGSGYGDHLGIFGTAGNTLTGTAYVATYILDTDAPASIYSNTATASRIDGGTGYGLPDVPALLGAITLNGITYGDIGHFTSSFQYQDHGDQHSITASVTNYGSVNSSLTFNNGSNFVDFLPSAHLDTVFTTSASSQPGTFYVSQGGLLTILSLDVASISAQVYPTSPVPEPATWAMFIGGFGVAGYRMRRTRKVAVNFA